MTFTAEPPLSPLDAETARWLDAVMARIDAAQLRATVERLPAPRCRCHWPEAMARTDELISAALTEAGCRVEHRAFACRRLGLSPVGAEIGRLDPRGALRGLNIVGIREGAGGDGAVVIGAHHDTVRETGGADDNGASVAALLALARALAPYRFRHSIVLAAFDMEELGLLGSRALVPWIRQQWRVRGTIVFETMAYSSTTPGSQKIPPGLGALYPAQVGRIRARGFAGDWTLILYRAASQPMACAFGEGLAHLAGRDAPVLVRDAIDLPVIGRVLPWIVPTVLHFGRSDHLPFWQAGLPAIMITDTANFRNPHYHRPSDRPETLDYERLRAIIGAAALAVARAAERLPSPDHAVD